MGVPLAPADNRVNPGPSHMTTYRFLAPVAFALHACIAQAQFLAVPQVESGFTIRPNPTNTLLRESPKARAILVSIPGGEGRIGLKPDSVLDASTARTSLGRMFVALTDPAQTSGSLHVVLFDSPVVLPMRAQLPERATTDHMIRIESVVRHYRDRFKLPVFLMGHSNGGYSIAEFQKHLADSKRQELVAGYIFSAGRDISSFGSPMEVPLLVMISTNDACHSTTVAGNQRIFEKAKASAKAGVDLVLIQGAASDGGDPCVSGTHMYQAAHEEVARTIDAFVQRALGPK